MAKAKKNPEKGPYLTKRRLVSAAKAGIRKAAAEAMEVMGYVVIAQDGWVIKKHADGRIEKVSPIDTGSSNETLLLD